MMLMLPVKTASIQRLTAVFLFFIFSLKRVNPLKISTAFQFLYFNDIDISLFQLLNAMNVLISNRLIQLHLNE